MAIKKLTCSKCNSTDINISWKYDRNNEMAMYTYYDWEFKLEDAIMKCAKCGCKKLYKADYTKFGKTKKKLLL